MEWLFSIPSEIAFKVVKKKFLYYFPVGNRLTIDADNIIEPGFDTIAIVSYYFPDNSFYSISFNGRSTFAGNHEAEAVNLFRSLTPTNAVFRPVENKPLAPEKVSLGKNGFDILLFFQPAIGRKIVFHLLFFTTHPGGQPFSALGAATGQNPAAALGGHPLAKTVIV